MMLMQHPWLGKAVLVCLCLCSVLGAGCHREDDVGVVARVNGTAIRVTDLEARHDLWRLGVPVVDNPTVERLRGEYGVVLTDMIIAGLVRQELKRLRQPVTEDDLHAAEAAVRADYPADAFERMLHQEHIDLDQWRSMLLDRLALDKFCRVVLRDNVRVGVSEAAAYYKDHIDTFTKPRRLRLARVEALSAADIKAALAAYQKAGNLEALAGLVGVKVTEMTLPEKNLPNVWREAVMGLKPGEATSIVAAEKRGLALIVLAREPRTVLDPSKAYARVESLLLEDRLEKAFEAWLAEALDGADIRVSPLLTQPEASTLASVVEPNEELGSLPEAPATSAVPETGSDTPARQGVQAQAAKPTQPATEQRDTPPATGQETGETVRTDTKGDARESAVAVPQTTDTGIPPASEVPSAALPGADAAATGQRQETADTAASMSAEAKRASGQPAAGEEQRAPGGNEAAGENPEKQVREEVPQQAFASLSSEAVAIKPQWTEADRSQPGEVVFEAVKGSWILLTVDGGEEYRRYLKPGNQLQVAFKQKLVVRLGSPSEVRYRYAGREAVVTVGKRESRTIEFP